MARDKGHSSSPSSDDKNDDDDGWGKCGKSTKHAPCGLQWAMNFLLPSDLIRDVTLKNEQKKNTNTRNWRAESKIQIGPGPPPTRGRENPDLF